MRVSFVFLGDYNQIIYWLKAFGNGCSNYVDNGLISINYDSIKSLLNDKQPFVCNTIAKFWMTIILNGNKSLKI